MNNIVPVGPGGWVWDGTQWVCDVCTPPSFPCPPGPPPFFPPPAGQPPWYPGANGSVTFSPTAPPNPIRGAFWWDGRLLWLFDGAGWVDVTTGGGGTSGGGVTPGPGPAATTTTIAMSLNQVANLSITPSTGSSYTETPWQAVPSLDIMNGFDPITKKWTPNRPGVYQVLIFGFAAVANVAYSQCVLKNDQGVFNFSTPVQVVCLYDLVGGGNSIASLFSATGMVTMNGTTDYLRHWTYSANGTIYQPLVSSPTWQVIAMP